MAAGARPTHRDLGEYVLQNDIAAVRGSIWAVLQIHPLSATRAEIGIRGTAWCVESNRLFVTARHVLNAGKPRDPKDSFELLTAPENGNKLLRLPVVGFHLEDSKSDYCVFEVDQQSATEIGIPAIPIYSGDVDDGAPAFTFGYPQAAVRSGSFANGRLTNIQTVLFSHANEGILAAHYRIRGLDFVELNIGWYLGESGGPVMLQDPPRVIAIMQRYRNIDTPHGVVPGPHGGFRATVIEKKVAALAAGGGAKPQSRAERRRSQRGR